MRRREFIMLIGGSAAWPLALRAQQPAMPVVGYLHIRGQEDAAHEADAFRRGLRDGGFVEGNNVRVEYRWASGHYDRLQALAAELVSLPVSVLAASGGESTVLAAKSATSTIPIVFTMSSDPVKLGLAASYNRPGGNVTGVNILSTSLEPKRLGLLHDLVPSALTIGFLVDSNFPPSERQVRDVDEAARAIGVRIRVLRVRDAAEIDAAFQAIAQEHITALAVGSSPFLDIHRDRLVSLAARAAVPTIYHFREYPVSGGLVSYGIDIDDAHRQIGLYAANILNGAKPADLPILQPTRFTLVINLKTAKALGLTIPSGVLAIADEVIE
jgi:putative tryptophan/tyrosine transport system substrate-binding protein